MITTPATSRRADPRPAKLCMDAHQIRTESSRGCREGRTDVSQAAPEILIDGPSAQTSSFDVFSRSGTERSVGRELAENDFESPRQAPAGDGDPHDRLVPDRVPGPTPTAHDPGESSAGDVEPAESDRRIRIVWVPQDESALDAFASESGVPDEVTSPAAVTHRPAVASATAPIQQRATVFAADTAADVEPGGSGQPMRIVWLLGNESALDAFASEPVVRDVSRSSPAAATCQPPIEALPAPVREPATARIPRNVRRGTVRRPTIALLERSVLAALAIAVTCGGMAGVYLRRNPAGRAVAALPVHGGTDQLAATPPPSGTASPPENDQRATASVHESLATARDELPVAPGPIVRGSELRREGSSLHAETIPKPTPASAPRGTAPLTPLRAANNASSSPLPVVSPQTPPTRIGPLAASGTITSQRGQSDEVPSLSQVMPATPRATVEASAIPSAAAEPVTPLAAASSIAESTRARETTPAVVAVPDDQRIAALLKRFTDAYTQLNATAAKAVWPSVDGRALARAFDELESQSIAFDDCTVRLSGADARAACVGNLTYVPKIGRRSARTVKQHWNFVMSKNSEGWTILDAQMR
jgi:hypothetical protein